jgi:aspartyl-tRNA(Asn)/glutamyl-tRNA(Gln) amidotransferase subunit A
VTEFHRLSAQELLAGYAAREFSPVEVVEALAARIEATEPVLNAYMTPTPERALAAARAAEERWRSGEARGLEGVPYGVKDLFDTAGVRTTYGSPMYDGHVPERDARAVERMEDAGAILLGKTATDEFAYGIAGVNPHYGAARNPWDLERVSGGSSSGSGVAVASGTVPLALGSDTGGSIRSPSSFCGIVGFKGTWGAISSDGMWAMGRSIDHAGPMARTPGDVALMHGVLVEGSRGREVAASLAAGAPGDLRVGVCPDLEQIALHPEVRAAFDSAVAVFGDVREVRFPRAGELLPAFVPIRDAETLYTHRAAGLFPDRRDGYSERTYMLLAAALDKGLDEYLVASANRWRLGEAMAELFREVDVLVAPTVSAPPVRIDDDEPDQQTWEAVGLHMVPENLLGLPACAVRAGFDSSGLPVGVQLVGAPGTDGVVLAAAQRFVDATPAVQERRPPEL